jgi:hypothetical protein
MRAVVTLSTGFPSSESRQTDQWGLAHLWLFACAVTTEPAPAAACPERSRRVIFERGLAHPFRIRNMGLGGWPIPKTVGHKL